MCVYVCMCVCALGLGEIENRSIGVNTYQIQEKISNMSVLGWSLVSNVLFLVLVKKIKIIYTKVRQLTLILSAFLRERAGLSAFQG